jgi:hypothetical protein
MSLTDIGSASNVALFHSVSITRCWDASARAVPATDGTPPAPRHLFFASAAASSAYLKSDPHARTALLTKRRAVRSTNHVVTQRA